MLASIISAREDEVKCLHSLVIIMEYFLGQHNPLDYFALTLEKRCEAQKSTIVCSQREPKSWASMILNDEVSANAITKRATKHYTVVINTKNTQ